MFTSRICSTVSHFASRSRGLPEDERAAIECHLEEYDRQTEAQRQVERDIAGVALEDENVKRLMTIPGIDMVVAVGVMSAIGRIERFGTSYRRRCPVAGIRNRP